MIFSVSANHVSPKKSVTVHFVSINLFVGGWILKDSQKFLINKFLIALPLIITYLIGPLGLFFYWVIRIFYAKRLSLYE